jgi:hypothetical protein
MPDLTPSTPVSRFAFPYPSEAHSELCQAILRLMIDGKRRSVLEMQDALGTRKELSARVRELRSGRFGVRWPFNDARRDGPDDDKVFRYQLDISMLRAEQRRTE